MKIALVRHGRPTFKMRGWVQAGDIAQLANTYEYAGIRNSPSLQAKQYVQKSKVVVCSDLPRSLESAQELGVNHLHAVDEIYRECRVPHFDKGSLVLPMKVWAVVLGVFWALGFSKNGEPLSAAKQRARAVAYNLIELAEEHDSVVLVGHAVLNKFVARELRALHWRGPRKPKKHYWAVNVYRFGN